MNTIEMDNMTLKKRMNDTLDGQGLTTSDMGWFILTVNYFEHESLLTDTRTGANFSDIAQEQIAIIRKNFQLLYRVWSFNFAESHGLNIKNAPREYSKNIYELENEIWRNFAASSLTFADLGGYDLDFGFPFEMNNPRTEKSYTTSEQAAIRLAQADFKELLSSALQEFVRQNSKKFQDGSNVAHLHKAVIKNFEAVGLDIDDLGDYEKTLGFIKPLTDLINPRTDKTYNDEEQQVIRLARENFRRVRQAWFDHIE